MEGRLRSGKLFAKSYIREVNGDQIVAGKSGDDEEQKGTDSGVDNVNHLVLTGSEIEREPIEIEVEKKTKKLGDVEGGVDGDKIESENVELSDNGKDKKKKKKRKTVDVGENIEEINLEEESSGKVQVSGRVLRSRYVQNVDVDSAGSEGSLVKESRENNGCEKIQVKVKEEKIELVSEPCTELKRKRGRPPKIPKTETTSTSPGSKKKKKKKKGGKRGRPCRVEKEDDDMSNGRLSKKLKGKRGRPCKVKKEEDEPSYDGYRKTLGLKRGRPPKLLGTNGVLKEKMGKVCKVGLKLHGIQKYNGNESSMEMDGMLSVKEDIGGVSLATEDQETSSMKSSKMVTTPGIEDKKGLGKDKEKNKEREVEPVKNTARQLVREKISQLLFAAGWTVEYRPRNDKDYKDAVYVSLNGKTHWSVTLAYKMLKMHYEEGDGEGKFYKSGFIFTPILDEEFNILTKVMVKKRVGKKKVKEEGECGNSTNIVVNKKHKKKLVTGSLTGKSKRKFSYYSQETSSNKLKKRESLLVRNHICKKTHNRKRCTLLVRNAMEGEDVGADGFIPYDGKRTLLAWMIDTGTVSLNMKVKYMNQRKTKALLQGLITRDGIHCECCGKIMTISDFEIHAGSTVCEPFQNIHLESGTSLLQCLLDSWNSQPESELKDCHLVDVNGEDQNDDTCGICGDGGNLICCDGCPSTFHQTCLEIKKFPSGDWHCVYCSCKFCGVVVESACQKDNSDHLPASSLQTCHMCEEKYHEHCNQADDVLNDASSCPSFCGKKCKKLFEKLQMLLGVKHELEEGYSWSLLRRTDVGCDILSDTSVTVQCSSKLVECNSKLAVAMFIMDECFLPNVDHRSGVNLIHNVVYNRGSNFNRLNYSGFFTAILERGDEIVVAASIRIHGNHLAEMPFIGTRYLYRRQGFCRRLLNAIESALSSLDVKKLVIPAISEMRETWISAFGFKPLELSDKQRMKNINILVFPGIDMLEKPLLNLQKANKNINIMEGSLPMKLNECQNMQEVLCRNSEGYLGRSALNPSSEVTALDEDKIKDERTVESNLQLHDGSLDETFGMTSDNVIRAKSYAGKNCLLQFDMYQGSLECMSPTMNSQDPLCGQNCPSTSIIVVGHDGANNLDCQLNQNSVSEEKSRPLPCIESRAVDSGIPIFSSGNGDERATCDAKVAAGRTATFDLNSPDGGLGHNFTEETSTTEVQEKVSLHQLEVSADNIFCHDLETKSQISNYGKEFKCYDSEHFSREKLSGNCEVEYTCTDDQNESWVLPESGNNYVDSVLPRSHREAEEDPKGGCKSLPVDCSYGSFQDNGDKINEVDVPAAFSFGSHLGDSIEINKLFESKDVRSSSRIEANMDKTKSREGASADSQVGFHCTDLNSMPQESLENVNSLREFQVDSQVEQVTATQSDPESLHISSNTSGVALICASNGDKSCSTPEVIVLSNQAR